LGHDEELILVSIRLADMDDLLLEQALGVQLRIDLIKHLGVFRIVRHHSQGNLIKRLVQRANRLSASSIFEDVDILVTLFNESLTLQKLRLYLILIVQIQDQDGFNQYFNFI